jgi:hypothetical protein
MVYTPNNYSIITVNNSITNAIVDEKYDKNKPFSFIEYLNYSKTLYKTNVNFTTYQDYIKRWNEITNTSNVDYNVQVKEQFIDFLKTISLNYTSLEERKYLTTINYNNPDELETAIPFFVRKIKDIILYYANKRDTYKLDYSLSLTKGSIDGVENFIRTTILETLFGDDTTPYITLQQPLSTISSNLKIEIEEGYDTYNNYFDLDPDAIPSFYKAVNLRRKYFSANTNKIDANLFLDFDQAIIDLINSEEVVLTVLQNLIINVNTPNIEYLQPYDFTDYTNVSRENLKLIYNIELIQKFTGTNFYYLSTNSYGEKLSGVLFESTSPYANLLNIHNPATLTVPQGLTKYEREVGLFFKPTNRSILSLQTPFSYTLKENIENDKIYIFPDPDNYGNISGVSKVEYETPLSFNLEGQFIQKNISSNAGLGNTLVTNNDFTFESYHSLEQKTTLNVLNSLYNNGVVTNYVSDIYGNIFIGLKQFNTPYILDYELNTKVTFNDLGASAIANVPFLSSIKPLLNKAFTGTSTVTSVDQGNFYTATIFNNKYASGEFFIYNVQNETFNSFNIEFANVLEKYPSQLYTLQNGLQNVEVFGSTFVLTTSSYKIIDKVTYTNGGFYKSSNVPFILSADEYNVISNVYNIGNNLYVYSYSIVDNPYTNLNTRTFKLTFYNYFINDATHKQCEFDEGVNNTFTYNYDTKLLVRNAILCYNEKTDTFGVMVNLKDTNHNFFLQTVYLKYNGNKLTIIDQNVYGCNNFNATINFYDPLVVNNLSLNSILQPILIDNTNGTIIL